MRHFKVISARKPARAQFDTILQIVSVISAVLGVFSELSTIVGNKSGT